MAVVTFRRKPTPGDNETQTAARYQPGQPLDDLAHVAHMADGYRADAELVEVPLPSGPILLVRYQRMNDEHPSEIDYEVVEPGQWLAWSPEHGFLYTTDDANWRQFYDQVTPE